MGQAMHRNKAHKARRTALSMKQYHSKTRSTTKQRAPKLPKQHDTIIEPRIATISRTIYKTVELECLLNALRSDNLLRLVQTIQLLNLDGYANPSLKQISARSSMGIATIKRNTHTIDIIKYALNHAQSFHPDTNDTTSWEHTVPSHMLPKSGITSHTTEQSTPTTNTVLPLCGEYDGLSYAITDTTLTVDDVTVNLPSRTVVSPIERVCIALGIPVSNTDEENTLDASTIYFKKIMHTLSTMALKDLKLIRSNLSLLNQQSYGVHLYNLYIKSTSGSGQISAQDKDIRWWNEQDSLQLKSKLFKTSNKSYQAGVYSLTYEPTGLTLDIMKRAIEYIKMLSFEENKDLYMEPSDFIIPISSLNLIRFQDLAILLNDYIGYKEGFIIRPQPLDSQQSRIYSCFTAISSQTRKILGFINYDIGAALQTICLGLVKDPSLYPLHQELIQDKAVFRQKVMTETGNDLAWVKQELSKLDNEPKGKQHKSLTLQAYYLEALVLRKDVINTVPQHVLDIANAYAKPEYAKTWDKQNKTYIFTPIGTKESSLFFFIWTQYERLIREAMSECFSEPAACQHVHDAIYSKEQVDIPTIEHHVLQKTNFAVMAISEDLDTQDRNTWTI